MSYNELTPIAGTGMGIDTTNPEAPIFNSTGTSSDSVISSLVATTTPLPAVTYDNGTLGVGATLTANANGVIPAQDGVTLMNGDLILVKNQIAQLQNGLYVVTDVGSVSTPFVLTRSVLADESDELDSLIASPDQGNTNKLLLFGQETPNPVVGTDPIIFAVLANISVTQGAAGTQVKTQIPLWNVAPRQLSRGTSDFTYNPSRHILVTDVTFNTVMIGNSVGFGSAGNNFSIFLGDNAGSGSNSSPHSIFMGDGAGSGAASANSVVIGGNGAGASIIANGITAIGSGAGTARNGLNSVYIGLNAGNSAINSKNCIFIGQGAGASDTINNTVSGHSILIGQGSHTGGFKDSIAMGTGAINDSANQFLIDSSYINFSMRGVNYVMPSANAAGVWTNDGLGNTSWTPPTPSVTTAAYGTTTTFASTDYNRHLYLTSSTGATTVDISAIPVGGVAIISDFDRISATSNITIDSGTGNTISGTISAAQTLVVSGNGDSVTIQRLTTTKFMVI